MSIDTVETLHAQHDKGDKWDHDLLVQTILEILKGPLNNDNYKNLYYTDAKKKVYSYLKVLEGTKYEKRSKRVTRKVEKCKSTEDIILYLGKVILSD